MQIKVCKLDPDAVIPTYGTDGSACFDITAIDVEHDAIRASAMCKTGLSFEIPEGHAMFVFSRSGQGFKKDIRLANCVGVIDSDYRGELMVKLAYDGWRGGNSLAHEGDRVAQAVILPVPKVAFEEVSQLVNTLRGNGGLGSTGA